MSVAAHRRGSALIRRQADEALYPVAARIDTGPPLSWVDERAALVRERDALARDLTRARRSVLLLRAEKVGLCLALAESRRQEGHARSLAAGLVRRLVLVGAEARVLLAVVRAALPPASYWRVRADVERDLGG